MQFAFGFDSLFHALKQNKLFTLPDVRTIKFDWNSNDPSYILATYKVGDKFRSYRMLCPRDYKKKYPEIKTFEHYNKLLDIFFNQLKERK